MSAAELPEWEREFLTRLDDVPGVGPARDPGETDPMWSPLFEEVWHAVSYKPGFRLLLRPDPEVEGGRWYFQVEADRPDTYTGEMGVGRGGKAYLSPHATRSELASCAFGLFSSYELHECREWFKYAGKRVYGPHLNVLALATIADATEHRGDPL